MELDCIPTNILKENIDNRMYNCTPSNYRPVNNLSFLSKVLEKIVLNQFNEHCEKPNLLPDYQSA